MKTFSWAIALATAGFSTLAVAQPSDQLKELLLDARQQASLGVRTAPVEATSSRSIMASAQVSLPPGHEVVVTAPYAGVVTRIAVGLGDSVAQGTVMAHLSSAALSEVRRQWREAQLDLDHARQVLRRDQLLFDEGVIPQARLDLALNRFRTAEAALAARDAELKAVGLGPQGLTQPEDFTSAPLRAPMGGSVLEASATVGQRVDAGTVLFKVANTRQLQLDISVSTAKAGQIRVGDKVFVPSRQASARIVGVSRSVDPSQLARARAQVIQPGTLSIGEVLPVQLAPTVGASQTQAWSAPAQAVIEYKSQSWVFAASSKGFVPTRVKVVSSDDDRSVLEGAITPSTRVAITGLASLRALLQQEP